MRYKVRPDKNGSSTYCAGVLIANKITEGIGQEEGMDVHSMRMVPHVIETPKRSAHWLLTELSYDEE